jgi:hypothetical protein
MLRDLKGEEGGAKGVVRGDGDAPEPRRGAFGDAAVEKAGSTCGGGGRIVEEAKEGERRHHCRCCSLSVWVASGVEAIQIIDERGGVVGVIKVAFTGRRGQGTLPVPGNQTTRTRYHRESNSGLNYSYRY